MEYARNYITLKTFVTFKVVDKEFLFFPEPRNVSKVNAAQAIVIGDIPLPEGAVAPPDALTLLYGHRDALDEMQRQYALAGRAGFELLKVEFKLKVGTDHPESALVMGRTYIEDLPRSRFLNLLSLNVKLRKLVLDGVNDRLQTEANYKSEVASYFENVVDAGRRGDLICDFVRSTKVFKHINSVAYRVPDGTPRGRQVCTILDTENVFDFTTRGEAPFSILLPKF